MSLYHGTDISNPEKLRENGIQPPNSSSVVTNHNIISALEQTRPDDRPPRTESVFLSSVLGAVTDYRSVAVVDPSKIPDDVFIYTGRRTILDQIAFTAGLHDWDLGSYKQSGQPKKQASNNYWDSTEEVTDVNEAVDVPPDHEIVVHGEIPSGAVIDVVDNTPSPL